MSPGREYPPDSGFEKEKTMKKFVVSIAFAAVLVIVFPGCGSPWVKSLTASLYEGDLPASMNDEDFGAGAAIAGTFDVNNLSDWDAAINTIKYGGNNKNYVINVTAPIATTTESGPLSFTFGGVTGITISLRGGGSLAYTGTTATNLFYITSGQHLIIRDFTLQGDSTNNNSLLEIASGGTATLKAGGKIAGNATFGDGAGVFVGGTFNMTGGEIVGNTTADNGGGVYVDAAATFIKTGGIIYGAPSNMAGNGDAVYSGAGGGKYRDDDVTDNISVNGGVFDGYWL
jgi:hypothetical protein